MLKSKLYIIKRKIKYKFLPKLLDYNPFDFNVYVFITNDMERVYSTPKSRLFNILKEFKNIFFDLPFKK